MAIRRETTTAIDKIFEEILRALTNAREQMFTIGESARAEYERIFHSVMDLKADVAEAIQEVERLEKESRNARLRLAKVSKNFSHHSQEAIREAYEAAEHVQVRLSVARERENSLRKRRDELERSLRNLAKMVQKADEMVSQVSGAMQFLEGDISEIADQWEGIKARYQIGEKVIKAQEEERRRVAREIHDGPAQAMANVVLRTEICERLLQAGRDEVTSELSHLKMLVKDALRELRRIIFDLRPMALDDLGLIPTLNRYLENLRQHEAVPVCLSVCGREYRLPSTSEVAVFRVVQEAINNSRRHAQASSIDVQVRFQDGNEVEIIVEDDGIGFDMDTLKEEWAHRESFGLMSMRERIELLGGEFEVSSVIGRGTRITARLSIDDSAEEPDGE